MFFVALICLVIGVSTAWFVTHYSFFSRNIVSLTLLLPLAMPAYLNAFVYTDFLDISGDFQLFIRYIFNYKSAKDYWFPEIRSKTGAIIFLSITLYPYVYLLARKAFLEQSQEMLQIATLFGFSKLKSFFLVSLPLARPAIIAGISLVMMETLSDFGTVNFFAVNTLSLAVYNVWLNMGDLGSATLIAISTLSFVFILFLIEKLSYQKQKQYQSNHLVKKDLTNLTKIQELLVIIWCWLPVFLGFIFPVIILVKYTIANFFKSWQLNFFIYAYNSFKLSFTSALLVVFFAFLIIIFKRFQKNNTKLMSVIIVLMTTGYVLPGTVLALSVISLMNFLFSFTEKYLPMIQINFSFLIVSIFPIIFAYLFKFFSIGIGAINSRMKQISPTLDKVAHLFGWQKLKISLFIYFPLLKVSLLTSFLIVFVDAMKELPLALLLRPFNFDTLATHVYAIASDERLEEAALAALMIVIAGIIPVHFLVKKTNI